MNALKIICAFALFTLYVVLRCAQEAKERLLAGKNYEPGDSWGSEGDY